jgi:hypothetical protein
MSSAMHACKRAAAATLPEQRPPTHRAEVAASSKYGSVPAVPGTHHSLLRRLRVLHRLQGCLHLVTGGVVKGSTPPCRDEAVRHADNAIQHRLLVEHYSRVLAERLIRQQAAVNAAAAATGRTLACISVATQTSESVLAAVARADAVRRNIVQGGASSSGGGRRVSGNIEGGEMAAALKARDGVAFQMLLEALNELPRQWMLALPARLLSVLAGEVRAAACIGAR